MRSRDENTFVLLEELCPGQEPQSAAASSALRPALPSDRRPSGRRAASRAHTSTRGPLAARGWVAAGGASLGLVLGLGAATVPERHPNRLGSRPQAGVTREAKTDSRTPPIQRRVVRQPRPTAPSASRAPRASAGTRMAHAGAKAGTRPITAPALAALSRAGQSAQEFSFER
jgi:hypothetical protein